MTGHSKAAALEACIEKVDGILHQIEIKLFESSLEDFQLLPFLLGCESHVYAFCSSNA